MPALLPKLRIKIIPWLSIRLCADLSVKIAAATTATCYYCRGRIRPNDPYGDNGDRGEQLTTNSHEFSHPDLFLFSHRVSECGIEHTCKIVRAHTARFSEKKRVRIGSACATGSIATRRASRASRSLSAAYGRGTDEV